MQNLSWAERRRYPRSKPADSRVAIAIGIGTSIFAELLDVSDGGACLRPPYRFRIDVGERLCLSGRAARGIFRVLATREDRLHLAVC